jgi:hypothetical protein
MSSAAMRSLGATGAKAVAPEAGGANVPTEMLDTRVDTVYRPEEGVC